MMGVSTLCSRHCLGSGIRTARIKSDNQAHLETTKMGSRVSTSVGGGANTGLGAQIIIIDIAHNAEEGRG
jgi:hypothetical protein